MARAGRIVADTLVLLRGSLRPGMTTRELNRITEDYLRRHGAVSSYREVEFDGVLCVSINDQVVHGIPGARVLREGDLVSLDLAAIYGGYHADAAITVGLGAISPVARRLLDVTEQSLALGISLATPGRPLDDISAVVQDFIEDQGFGVVRNLVGHGIGRSMWEPPEVPNYRPEKRGPVLRSGMTFTIEPMVNAGRPEVVKLEDDWTIVSEDGSLSAHFEHTLAVTDHGPRVLTVPTDRAAAWALSPPRAGVGTHLPGPAHWPSLADVNPRSGAVPEGARLGRLDEHAGNGHGAGWPKNAAGAAMGGRNVL
jgi:methionyl aminopeptidase